MTEQLIPNGTYVIYPYSSNSKLVEREMDKFQLVSRQFEVPPKQKFEVTGKKIKVGTDEEFVYTFKTLESEKYIWAYSHEPVQQGTEVVGYDTGAEYRIIIAEPPADRFIIIDSKSGLAWSTGFSGEKIVLLENHFTDDQKWIFRVATKEEVS